MQSATSAWNSKKAALARAEVTSTKTEQATLESSISSLEVELNDLNARLTVAKQARNRNILMAAEDKGDLSVDKLVVKKPPPVAGGSRWQEISITTEQQYSVSNRTLESKASSERWNVDFWIGSAGGSNEHTEANFLSTEQGGKIQLEISMKVTLVTVDRSSWFQVGRMTNSTCIRRLTLPSHNSSTTPRAS